MKNLSGEPKWDIHSARILVRVNMMNIPRSNRTEERFPTWNFVKGGARVVTRTW